MYLSCPFVTSSAFSGCVTSEGCKDHNGGHSGGICRGHQDEDTAIYKEGATKPVETFGRLLALLERTYSVCHTSVTTSQNIIHCTTLYCHLHTEETNIIKNQ